MQRKLSGWMAATVRGLAVLLLAASLTPAVAGSGATIETAQRFVDDAEAQLLELWIARERAAWVKANFITRDTEAIEAAQFERLMAVTAELAELLADTYVLYLKSHSYHWNVTGPMFQTLHLMFEDHYTEMWGAVDIIAERIRALGEPAPGTYAEFSRLTSIEEVEGVPAALEMVADLVAGHESVIRTARRLVATAEEGQWMAPPRITNLEAWFKEDLPLQDKQFNEIKESLGKKPLVSDEATK